MNVRAFLVLLLCTCLWDQSVAQKKDKSKVELLAKEVLKAAELQDAGHESDKVVSDLVDEAPAAELANGDGDVSTTGACSLDRDTLCIEVPPGEGRLAKCIRTHIKNEELGNVTGRRVTDKCKEEVRAFYADRGNNVNKNLQLATACKADIKKHCKDLPQPVPKGAVLACLRSSKKNLTLPCKLHVIKSQLSAANDYKSDAALADACTSDADRLCSDVPAGGGRVQACLRDKPIELTWNCREELFRQEVENADDIRLDVRLFTACRGDQKRFCPNVEPGSNRVKECLEEFVERPKFSPECKREFTAMMEARAGDFRLDPALREACEHDIDTICGYQESGMDAAGGNDAPVITCLVDYRADLTTEACKKGVHRVIERQASDIRMDEPLSVACRSDRNQFCADHTPGSAHVIRCLQEHRENLKYQCTAALFDLEVRMGEDIDFNYPLKQHCAAELQSLCTGVKRGSARIIRCLHSHVDASDMGSECRTEVRRSMNNMAQDYRLNHRLAAACAADIDATCKDACASMMGEACGGTVLRCLQDNIDNLKGAECKEEVFYFVKMEVSDFRNDVMLATACRKDVDVNCAEVEPGEGRVLECLRMHRSSLSEGCLAEEMKLSQQQSRDVRLRPKLMKLCGEEMVTFCKKVAPGGGRVFNCLLENAQKPTFGTLCKEEVLKRENLAKSDYRLDAGVSTDCATDVEEHCAAAKRQAHGQAGVLKCLVDKMVDASIEVAAPCEAQMSRAVRMAFWDFQAGAALTTDCDDDINTVCPSLPTKKNTFTIGAVGRCLSRQLAEGKQLTPGCRKIVSVAAPKDIRVYLQETMNSDGTLKTSGLRGAMEKAMDASSTITLTGWVAYLSVGCAVFLAIFGGVWVYRRYSGLDKPYTLLVPKDGSS